VYSDGISEAWPAAEEAEAFLADMVRAGARHPIEGLRTEIFAAADNRRGRKRNDDCTLVLLRRGVRPARGWRSSET
jgi:serine phosphatase RsbU (regulator of sigma subunit)